MPPRQVTSSASPGRGWIKEEYISPEPTTTNLPSTTSPSYHSSAGPASSHDGHRYAAVSVTFGSAQPQSVSVGLSLGAGMSARGSVQVYQSPHSATWGFRVRLMAADGRGHHSEAEATTTSSQDLASPSSAQAQSGRAERSASIKSERDEGDSSSAVDDGNQSANSSSLAASPPSPRSGRGRHGRLTWTSQSDRLLEEVVAANTGARIHWKVVVRSFNHLNQDRRTIRGLQARWRVLEGQA